MCRLGQSLTLGCVEEFTNVAKALAPLAPTLAFLKMINTLLVLHPLDTNSPYLHPSLDFKPNLNLEFSADSFRSVFLPVFHLLTGGPLGMVLKYLQDYFDLEDSTNGFIQLHQLCSHVAVGRIPRSMV